MPLYEYECTACHKRTEKRQKFSDPEITDCPFCGGKLERVLSAPAISFKGGGWYKDLYSSAKPAPSGNSGDAPAAKAEGAGGGDKGGSAASGESAPAAAPSTPAAAPAAPSAPSNAPAKS